MSYTRDNDVLDGHLMLKKSSEFEIGMRRYAVARMLRKLKLILK
jgi:hypothetical protein